MSRRSSGSPPGYNLLALQHTVSVLVENISHIDPSLGDGPVHGASLSVGNFLRNAVRHERVDKLEVFLPPSIMANQKLISGAAASILPRELMGKGKLSFYPFHSIPEVWADPRPRIIRTADPELFARDRYLRDRFAAGPTPICCDTHVHGVRRMWMPLERVVAAPPAPYDSIVSLSAAHAEAMRKLFDGFLMPKGSKPPFRIDVIGRPIDCNRFKPVEPAMKSQIRKEIGWPSGKIVLFLARVTAHGKADLVPLVRAFAEVSRADETLVIVGGEATPGTFNRLKAVAKESGISNRLIVSGEAAPEHRWKCFAAADIYVLPGDTIQESFGNTVLEAMASGLPVIVSDWDGFRDMVRDGENGFLVPTWWVPGLDRIEQFSPINNTDYLLLAQSVYVDRNELAKRLRELLDSEDLRAQFGEAGRKRSGEFSNERITEQLVSLWDEQHAAAALESEAAREARREAANALGLPTPYLEIFKNYATGCLPDDRKVLLSAYGKQIMAGKMGFALYEDTIGITHGNLFEQLTLQVAEAGDDGIKVVDLVERAAKASAMSLSDTMFHLGLLLKSDAFDLGPH